MIQLPIARIAHISIYILYYSKRGYKVNKQTIFYATAAISSAIQAGDTLKEALKHAKSDFFKLSRCEWLRVVDWAESEFKGE